MADNNGNKAGQAAGAAVGAVAAAIEENKKVPAFNLAALLTEIKKTNPDANRFDVLFESYTFSPGKSDKTYKSENNGQLTKTLADIVIVFLGGFAFTPGTIKLKQNKGGAKPFVEMAFFQTMIKRAIDPVDNLAQAELTDWKRRVALNFQTWAKANNIAQAGKPAAAAAVEAGDFAFSTEDAGL